MEVPFPYRDWIDNKIHNNNVGIAKKIWGVFMSRYRGPRFKKIRRLGTLPGLTSKKPTVGREFRNQSRSERQLLKYIRIAGKAKGSTGQVLLQLLEMRLDNILFRLGMASTIPQARQLVNHKHVLVNGRIVDIPSYRCKPQDIITAKDEQKSKALIQNSLDSSPREELPNHLTLHPFQYKGLIDELTEREGFEPSVNKQPT
ncbi:hypothetical protein Ahy_A08g038874 [Arachis hypogaea]|uniref:Small ribosomal subunit protein uS4c n=1 Tax=Arachis hypogaea TaxID=3818 RepID=A0A445BV07_ARAHY|nr:hypothetical protein Ahy_A08g038874 [Arachis hypogaea]